MTSKTYTLTLLDTTGIQDYIFSSNRLQENIGASELVYRATSLWAFETLHTVAEGKHNILNHDALEWEYNEKKCIEDGELDAEVIQAAGGNLLLLFKDHQKAIEFVQKLTLKVLQKAPGITLLAQHLPEFDFENKPLGEAREALGEMMKTHKLSRLPSSPTLGLGVTAACASTGLPAVRSSEGEQDGVELLVGEQKEKESEKNRLISRETTFKLVAREWANDRLKYWLGEAIENYDYQFPFDLDKLGRIKGEESYYAIVHADGNHMGDHVQRATANTPDNREWIKKLREFSQIIHEANLNALQRVVSLLADTLTPDGDIPYMTEDGIDYLPFRPLVFGGDDLTFVCNGKIGVSLAAMYIEEFHKAAEELKLDNLYASAGVAMVKMHYPFARAYKLSEELIQSAKSLNREPKPDCSAIDWHFAQSGLSGSLKSIRKREYEVDAGKLYLRPLTLEGGEDFRSWDNLKAVIEAFQNKDEEKWAHNKVIGLREPLRKGKEATLEYRQNFGLPKLPEFEGDLARKDGWANGRCYYFDAIELIDHYAPIKEEN